MTTVKSLIQSEVEKCDDYDYTQGEWVTSRTLETGKRIYWQLMRLHLYVEYTGVT